MLHMALSTVMSSGPLVSESNKNYKAIGNTLIGAGLIISIAIFFNFGVEHNSYLGKEFAVSTGISILKRSSEKHLVPNTNPYS